MPDVVEFIGGPRDGEVHAIPVGDKKYVFPIKHGDIVVHGTYAREFTFLRKMKWQGEIDA